MILLKQKLFIQFIYKKYYTSCKKSYSEKCSIVLKKPGNQNIFPKHSSFFKASSPIAKLCWRGHCHSPSGRYKPKSFAVAVVLNLFLFLLHQIRAQQYPLPNIKIYKNKWLGGGGRIWFKSYSVQVQTLLHLIFNQILFHVISEMKCK